MKKFSEYILEISEAKGDTKEHKYSKNTLEELELLLKHHKEDLEELKDSDKKCEGEDEILKDIEEIKNAIKVKSINEANLFSLIDNKRFVGDDGRAIRKDIEGVLKYSNFHNGSGTPILIDPKYANISVNTIAIYFDTTYKTVSNEANARNFYKNLEEIARKYNRNFDVLNDKILLVKN